MAAAPTRVYKVVQSIGDTAVIRLVRAVSPAAAIKHVTEDSVKCEILTADDALVLGARGIDVETAGADPEPDPAAATEPAAA